MNRYSNFLSDNEKELEEIIGSGGGEEEAIKSIKNPSVTRQNRAEILNSQFPFYR